MKDRKRDLGPWQNRVNLALAPEVEMPEIVPHAVPHVGIYVDALAPASGGTIRSRWRVAEATPPHCIAFNTSKT